MEKRQQGLDNKEEKIVPNKQELLSTQARSSSSRGRY